MSQTFIFSNSGVVIAVEFNNIREAADWAMDNTVLFDNGAEYVIVNFETQETQFFVARTKVELEFQ